MQPSKTEPALTRLPFGMAVLVGISIILALFSISFPIKPVVASPPLDPALEQAVSTAIRNQQPNATTAHIIVSPISRVKAWVFGSTAIIPQPSSDGATDQETAPQILLFFAEQRDGGWQVALEHTPAFAQALTRIPQHLLTPEQWSTMPTTAQLSGDGSMQLNLPWAVGETWNLTGGPHDNSRSALDFAVNGGRVRAAREGVAYTPCGQSSDLVRIDHPGGFSTNYYHLAGIAVTNGSWVERYTYLGMIGTGTRCLGGYVTGAHVQFWITRGTTPVPIDGIDIGGWTVSALPGDYNGCMTRIRDGYRQCTRYGSSGLIEGYGRITNEGNIPPNPPYLISPDNDAIIKTATVTLQVADAGDPDNWPRPIRNFFFRITKSDNSWSASSDWTDNTSWTVTLPSEGTYLWIVYAGDWELSSAAAGPRTLTYIPNRPPNPPNLLSPAHTATINTATVTLQATDGGDPDNWPNQTRRFRFIIALSDNSWRADSGWINSPSWTVQLPRIGEYVWQAQANDGAADSNLTVQRKLYYTIAAPVPPPQPPTPAPNVWQVPYFSQLDSRWGTQPINRPAYATYCNNTIGQIGCALTSLTMVARFYGVDHNPGTMNTCLGTNACPLYWASQQVRTCTNNKMRWVSWPTFSYSNLQTELRKGPVILELSTSAGYMHFIVVLGGSGTDPANYTVHDPGVRNGAYTTLANVLRYWRGYQPSSMRIYTGTPAPLPASLAEEATDSPASQADQVEPVEPLASPPLLNGATITGAIAPYRNTSTQMVLELAAQSAAGAVTEMRVWTNAEQSTVWQPFSRYVSVPLAETYYVQFRDSSGNTSAVISTGLPQVRNLNVFTTFIPITRR